jgi:hypothetical protein
MKNCTDCKYAEWRRTKSGALHPSGDGKCTFEYKLPPLPASRTWLTRPFASSGFISRREELLDHCPCYARGEK